MSRWIFEPGHTEAEFRARHMMVTWVRGLFKDVHGAVELDWDRPLETTFHGEIAATRIWTGEQTRDAHLRSPDFFDVQHHPRISFTGHIIERTGDMHAKASVDLTIRGITRPVILDVAYHGQWETPYWVGEENRGTLRRIGFAATTTIKPRLRRVVAGPSARWRCGGQQRGRGLSGRGGDPRGGPGAHWRDPVLPARRGADAALFLVAGVCERGRRQLVLLLQRRDLNARADLPVALPTTAR